MAKRDRATTEEKIERRIREGRGRGYGVEYRPWLTIQDVPSQGLATRAQGWKTGREHHLMSKGELHYFLALEWSPIALDVREQFPLLPLDDTRAIAREYGFRHPTDPKSREQIVMTTDFLVTVDCGDRTEYRARAIKRRADLADRRTLEKLEIERAYWRGQGVDWGVVTEDELPMALVSNVEWLHFFRDATACAPMDADQIDRVAELLTARVREGRDSESLAAAADWTDDRLGLPPGSCLTVSRHLIASRRWLVDMHEPIDTRSPLRLLATQPGLKAQRHLHLAPPADGHGEAEDLREAVPA